MPRALFTRVAVLLFAALGCTACAISRLQPTPTPTTAPPSVIAASGSLGEKAANRLIDSRLGDQDDDPHIHELVESFRQVAAAPLVAGNRCTLLIDGPQTLDAMRKAIQGAKHHIHLETYIFSDDEVGRAVRDLLLERRAAGLTVRVLYDGIGSLATPAAFFDDMRASGIEVRAFRSLNPFRTPLVWEQNNRDHRKLIIVDGRIAFTGGINITSTYMDSSTTRPGPELGVSDGWRDTHIMIEGPVAAQFQSLFLATWTATGGIIDAASTEYFPQIPPAGRELIAAVATDGTKAAIYATYLSAIERATQRIWLTNAYFAPNRKMRKALLAAVKRGVDVRLIVPGFTDSSLILHASRASFDELLDGGVRIFEQRYALLHAKTAVIDGALSTVGSSNLDMRSFLHNNEVNAVVVGTAFASRLEQVFQRDQTNSTELDLASWRKRSVVEKLKEVGSSLFSYWL